MTTDWIVAGAGHNGLTAACYLAKAGETVLALDQADVAGGGASTREWTLPGYRHNLHAMRVRGLTLGPVFEELELGRYGVDLILRDEFSAHVFDDGRALVRYLDVERTVRDMERFSKRDARAYRDLFYETQDLRAAAVRRRIGPPAPPGGPPAIDPSRPLSATLNRWYHSSLIQVVRELFEDEHIQVFMRGSAQAVSYPGDLPLTGLDLVGGIMATHSSPLQLIRGGSAEVARALERILAEHGGAVRTGARVREILVENGRAVGVALDSGERLRAAKGVIAGFGHKVLLDTIDTAGLPDDFVGPIERFRGEEIVLFAVHGAVEGPVQYHAAADNPDVDRCLDVTFGLNRVIDLIKQYNDCREGALPRVLGGFCDIPSVWDASYAPPGGQVIDIGINVPYRLSGSPDAWDDVAADFGDRLVSAWLQYVDVPRERLLRSFTYSPLDIVRANPSFFEASPIQGSPLPDQMGIFRPAYGWAEYATPIEGLYVAGSTAHPMGGLSGIPGHHCASRIAHDYGISAWWPSYLLP
ncbi:MAG: NAD(P)/FAD-dependent oxidoreductase [Dehalococcoidia bacterium]